MRQNATRRIKSYFNKLCHEIVPAATLSLYLSGGLNLNPLKFLVFDWNWRDQKLKRMMDIPEVPCNQQLPLIFSFFFQIEFEFKHSHKVFDMGSQHILAFESYSEITTITESITPLTYISILSMCFT